jgi:hypothetical protein
MLPLVEFPQIVQHYAPWFESVVSAEALVQFQRYLSGLLISENKTVDGINRLFVIASRHQSSLNRLLTASPFSEAALNRQRLALLNSLAGTRVKPKGVLSVDDTLLTHYGHHFDEIAYLYDPVNDRYTWARAIAFLPSSPHQGLASRFLAAHTPQSGDFHVASLDFGYTFPLQGEFHRLCDCPIPGHTTWSTCTTATTKRTTQSISSCGNRQTWTRSSRACRHPSAGKQIRPQRKQSQEMASVSAGGVEPKARHARSSRSLSEQVADCPAALAQIGKREPRAEATCHVRQLVHPTRLLPFSGPRTGPALRGHFGQ